MHKSKKKKDLTQSMNLSIYLSFNFQNCKILLS